MAKQKSVDIDISGSVLAARKAMTPAVKKLEKSFKSFRPSDMTGGQLADLLYQLRQVSKSLGAITADIDEYIGSTIKIVEDHFVESLSAEDATGVQGATARVQVTTKNVPVVEDWAKVYAHIKKTGEFDLLNRAVNRAAVNERWDDKKQVPGVGLFIAKSVSCTKLKGVRHERN